MKKIVLLICFLSCTCFAFYHERNDVDRMIEDLDTFEDILEYMHDDHKPFDYYDLYVPKHGELTAQNNSQIMNASLTLSQQDTVREQAQGKLVGFYMINEKLNTYQALFIHKDYQLVCKDGECFERFSGERNFKPAHLTKAANTLQKEQIEKILVLQKQFQEKAKITQAKKQEIPSVLFNLIQLPDQYTLESRIKKLGAMDHFLAKTKLLEQLAGQRLPPWAIGILVEAALFSYTKDVSEITAKHFELRKCEILKAILADNPSAIEEFKDFCDPQFLILK